MTTEDRFDTRAIHAGELHPRPAGAAVTPIYQCTVFERHEDAPGVEAPAYGAVTYPRLSNLPNHRVLGAKLADLENAEAAVVTASGMAAISTAMLSVLRSGDHLLVAGTVYGGTWALLRDVLPDLGIEHTVIDPFDASGWEAAKRATTRAVWSEALSNPLVRVPDHPALVRFARDHDLVTMIDATFASPHNFRPLEHGYDLVVHSATKYLNGHSDIAAGCVAGSAARIERVKQRLDLLGGSLDAHACFLLERGVRTLGLRVRQQNRNAQALAEALATMPAVSRVHYPGLREHVDHDRAAALFGAGRCGGVLSFEIADSAGSEAVGRLLQGLRLCVPAPSLGGIETLVTSPRLSSHASLTPQERAALGIPENLVRVAVGIEDPEDLVADFRQALEPLA